MSVDIQSLVKVLKTKRESEGLSLRALSTQIGVSFSSLARIERGDGEPDNNSIIRILEWLGKDGRDAGLSFENVALVHFRANKNIDSRTVKCLLQAADCLKHSYGSHSYQLEPAETSESYTNSALSSSTALTKSEMEDMARDLRENLGVASDEPLNALDIEVTGVQVLVPGELKNLDASCFNHLCESGSDGWSAMSVPLDANGDEWAILRNDQHTLERQFVTYLEECWHILLDHKLTKIARISDAYGRTYDSNEEHDAYYLAGATLLPAEAVVKAVKESSASALAAKFGVSQQLVEYRIKRLGLWLDYKGKEVKINSSS